MRLKESWITRLSKKGDESKTAQGRIKENNNGAKAGEDDREKMRLINGRWRGAVFVPLCARTALTSPPVLAGRWVLSWCRLKDGVPCRRLPG